MIEVFLAASIEVCSWNNPGHNPYRKPPVEALQNYNLTEDERIQFRIKMGSHDYDDIVVITRDSIKGKDHEYKDLRNMHFGNSRKVCRKVDRSKWPATQEEIGLVYRVNDVTLVVPTVCNNVSMLTPVVPVVPPKPKIELQEEEPPKKVNEPSSLALIAAGLLFLFRRRIYGKKEATLV